MGIHEPQQGLNDPCREEGRDGENKDQESERKLNKYQTLIFMLPVCMLGMYRQRLAAKVFASIDMPDHRDFPQNHPALRHWETTGGTQQIGTASGPGEVAVLHLDGPGGQHCDHRLPIFWL